MKLKHKTRILENTHRDDDDDDDEEEVNKENEAKSIKIRIRPLINIIKS